jgi:hypothetical protein
MPNIVNVSVSQQVASAPSTLQRTGAFVSQGGTTLAAGSTALLTQLSDLTSILSGSVTIASIVWSTGIVTVTTSSAHGIPSGDTVNGIIAGVKVGTSTANAYNGTYAVTSTGATTFTYAVASNPGSATLTSGSIFTLENVQEIVAMATTYFAQGTGNAVYVLELGVGTPAQGITALAAYIANPTIRFYSYLLTTDMSNDSTFPTFANNYTSTTAQTYFYVTVTASSSSYSAFENIKSIFALAQAPTAPVTEWSAAAAFAKTLSYNPSASDLASPLEYSFVYAVTPYSTLTNSQQTTLLAAGVNWIGTGAQGQISNTLIEGGTFMDLNPFNYWYCVDWLAINVQIALAAAIINGSNNPTNPLYYNQAGINALQKVAQATVNNGIAFGLILSPATVAAVSFVNYTSAHPGDYAAGIYNGLSCTFVPLRGFSSITIYLTASNIPA